MKQKSETNRIEVGGAGIGEISEEMIQDRARAYAVSDGRSEVNALDLEQARKELTGSASDPSETGEDSLAEEDRPGTGSPASASGSQAPRLVPDDENNLAAEEVEEGVAEAEFDTRVQSRHRG